MQYNEHSLFKNSKAMKMVKAFKELSTKRMSSSEYTKKIIKQIGEYLDQHEPNTIDELLNAPIRISNEAWSNASMGGDLSGKFRIRDYNFTREQENTFTLNDREQAKELAALNQFSHMDEIAFSRIFYFPDEPIQDIILKEKPKEANLPFPSMLIEFNESLPTLEPEKYWVIYLQEFAKDITPDKKRRYKAYLITEDFVEIWKYFDEDWTPIYTDGDKTKDRLGEKGIQLIWGVLALLNSENIIKKQYLGKTSSDREAVKNGTRLPEPFYICQVEDPATKYLDLKRFNRAVRDGYNFEFDVRGHWRHLNSEKYTTKKGEKIWISPYKKGHGVYIPKRYAYERTTGKITTPQEVILISGD